ncbi:MAG: 4Fe-4S binding protein [Bacteroidales bacterium]|nr:4Fe-4S binding protein [Bacteroidales bacterium]MDD3431638.1 4Fe-4S binding protein [Bacteroidales bacterium]MDD4361424.1 4Fe-4S binding protein [Bacteroidales bacterium]MDD4430291.1 4Fe-4S binding protein [Bacteroidales bacterium]
MAIPTTRTKEPAVINIDEQLCRACGLCVSVCKDFGLRIENNKASRVPLLFQE